VCSNDFREGGNEEKPSVINGEKEDFRSRCCEEEEQGAVAAGRA